MLLYLHENLRIRLIISWEFNWSRRERVSEMRVKRIAHWIRNFVHAEQARLQQPATPPLQQGSWHEDNREDRDRSKDAGK